MKKNQWKKALAGWLVISCGWATAGCESETEALGTEEYAVLGIASLFAVRNPGTCSYTSGSRTVPIQEYDLSSNTTLSFPNGFTYAYKNWAAIKIPAASDGMKLSFNFTPWYTAGGKTYYLVYNESGCPLDNNSNADMNYTFPDLESTRTPTNYTVSGNELTFNSSAAGKSFVIVVVASSLSGSESVTRSVP